MKLKRIAVIFTIVMAALMLWINLQVTKQENNTLDMVFYNREVKQIEQALLTGETREEIAQKYGCEILIRTDANYASRLNQYLENESIILDYEKNDEIVGKFIWQEKSSKFDALREQLQRQMLGVCVIILLAVYVMLFLIYKYYVKPFQTLQEFTAEIAKGNLELALPIQKHNFFGAFTESFDLMRQELRRARESEYQANVSKKELIAELSHDIKTPIATIKATCEVMQVVETKQDTLDKIGVIASKAEMIDNLIGNMFHATLEELEVLKVDVREESSLLIPQMFQDFRYYGQIVLENEIPECLLLYDKLRLQQVLDNILNNSYKYAGTVVKVRFREEKEGITIEIRDFGAGVSEEEMALIREKFYRGSNTDGKSGSGLGLYLANNFMEQMGGGMECYNEKGFVVALFLAKA
ncbi:MAG: HAMP domain-containing histidine kinase [Lachnospiraceae bacterium]|nr:HAMP domain-containing histidine kinase [Lachnospiraceae bacterium]